MATAPPHTSGVLDTNTIEVLHDLNNATHCDAALSSDISNAPIL